MNIYLLLPVISFLLSMGLMSPFSSLFRKTKLVIRNYRGEYIPSAMGLPVGFAVLISMGILFLFNFFRVRVLSYMFGLSAVLLLGFIDDLLGDESYKGFKGHFRALFEGHLTTGLLKAGGGFLISLFVVSIISNNFLELVVNTFLIILAMNFINLFDLQPGRAGKVFLISVLSVLILNYSDAANNIITYSTAAAVLAYLPHDLKGQVMMGDSGANFLGFTLGMVIIYNTDLSLRVVIMIMLFGVNLLSEKISFSKIIERNKVFNYLDQLGR